MAKASPKIPDEQLDEFLRLLEEAMGRGRVKRSDLAMAMNVDPSLITKIFSRQARLRSGDFSRAIAPFLIIRGGLTEPAQVRQMAELLGEQLGAADLLNIGMRAKVYATPEDPAEIAAAYIQRVKEEKPAPPATPLASSEPAPDEPSLESIAQPIQEEKLPPPTPAAPPISSESALDWSSLDALAQYLRNETTHLPGACGYQMPVDSAIDRTVTVMPIIGDPALPDAIDVPLDVKRMSGILSGVPGSGRTAWMLKLAHAWATHWGEGKPLAICLKAPELLRRVGLRRDIFDFATEMVFPPTGAAPEKATALRSALKRYDEMGKILWLVDDWDRLSETDQRAIPAHLVSSPAIYAACPWQVPNLAKQIYAHHLGEFALQDLEPEQQRQMLTQVAEAQPERGFDLSLGRYALDELPDLARLPIGLLVIYACIVQHASAPTQIVESAIQEYFRRANQECSFGGEWIALAPAVKSLLHAGAICLADSAAWGDSYLLIESRYEETVDPAWACKWDYLTRPGLLEVHHVETSQGETVGLRFWNRDILAYCAAYPSAASWWNRAGSIHLSMKGTADQAKRFAEVLHKQTKKIAA